MWSVIHQWWKRSSVVYSSTEKHWHTYFLRQASFSNFLLTPASSARKGEVKRLSLSSESNPQEILLLLSELDKGFKERWYFQSTNFLVYKFHVVWAMFSAAQRHGHCRSRISAGAKKVISKCELAKKGEDRNKLISCLSQLQLRRTFSFCAIS